MSTPTTFTLTVASVARRVVTLRASFAENPLIRHMHDASIPVTERLDWAHYFAYFANAFSDINRYILPYADPRNELERLINSHSAEDAEHNGLIVRDMRLPYFADKLGQWRFADCLEFLWSDALAATRLIAYGIAGLATEAIDPRLRYCLIVVIEELGNEFFEVSHRCNIRGSASGYFGEVHLGFEPGHLHLAPQRSDALQLAAAFEQQPLDAVQAELAWSIMRRCHDLFVAMVEQVYELAAADRRQQIEVAATDGRQQVA